MDKKLKTYEKMKEGLFPDLAYITNEIQEKSQELLVLIEEEMIKIMKSNFKSINKKNMTEEEMKQELLEEYELEKAYERAN